MGELKPSNVFVGVIQFFAVFMPGALLTAAAALMLEDFTEPPAILATDAAQWAAFAFISYVVGALVFSIASQFDDAYDRYRRGRWREDASYLRATALRRRFFRQSGDAACDKDGRPLDVPMNTFAWSKALLLLRAPEAHTEVQRYEADSKFFRSLILVLPIAGVLAAIHWRLAHPLIVVSLPLLGCWLSNRAFARYAEERRKSTEWAYRYVIALQEDSRPPEAKARPAEA